MYFLRTFGTLVLTRDGAPVEPFGAQRKALALLTILATGGPTSRDRLMALLWPESDTERARGSLKQTIHVLRHQLRAPRLLFGRAELGLDPTFIDSDVRRFVEALDGGDRVAAIALWRGPFLDGVHLEGSVELEQWVDARRAELTRRHAGALEQLALQAEAQADGAGAVQWWRRLQALEPLDGRVALRLMQALERTGERTAALRHARVHAELVRAELDLTPDPAVTALAERLRRAPPDEAVGGEGASAARAAPVDAADAAADDAGPPESVPAGPPASGRAPVGYRRRAPLAALALVLLLVAAFYGSRGAPADGPRDPNLVAVAPFDVPDPSLRHWSEGLADILAEDLDGAGPLRTVPPSVALRRWQGRADRLAAAALGARTGAGLVVFGHLVRRGADSVGLRAAILDRSRGTVLRDLTVVGAESRMGELAESLGVQLLRAVGEERPIGSVRRVSIGARPLPALKAFLRGEQFYRRRLYDSALVHFHESVTQDPDFAVALRRMWQALGWRNSAQVRYGSTFEYRRRAVALNRGLAPRDSLLLVADSLELVAAEATQPDGRIRAGYGIRAVLEQAARRLPEDPEIWFELGERRYHWPAPLGGPPARSLEAFERAIALDPGFGPAYEHLADLAMQLRRPDHAAHYARIGAELDSTDEASPLRLTSWALDSGVGAPTVARALAAASDRALWTVGTNLGWSTDSGEAAIAVFRHQFAEGRDDEVPPGALAFEQLLRPRRLAAALAYRGRLRAATEILGTAPQVTATTARAAALVDPFLELALFGAVPDSVARRAFDDGLDSSADWGGPPRRPGTPDVLLTPRYLHGAPWWLARNDTIALQRFAARAARAARDTGSPIAPLRGRYLHGVASAYVALAQGDSARAVHLLQGIPDTLCLVNHCFHEQVRLARLLAASGDARQAASLLDRWGTAAGPTPSAVLAALERARLAERLADTATAGERYRFVVEAWRHADPELQPFVSEAGAGLERMRRR
jgi:DNA-binding SARP family transcriptional activator